MQLRRRGIRLIRLGELSKKSYRNPNGFRQWGVYLRVIPAEADQEHILHIKVLESEMSLFYAIQDI